MKRIVLCLFVCLLGGDLVALGSPLGNTLETHWFPAPPGHVDNNPTVDYKPKNADLYDSKHGIKMGVASPECDDAKTNLTVDWDFSPVNYTCFEDRALYLPDPYLKPTFSRDHIPAGYVAQHKCMQTKIVYDDDIPTFGSHRPLWAKFGEYRFLPPQRWLHDLEHGAVAVLYHPCADPNEVEKLKALVKSCLYRYIITPYTKLTKERPLALVTWGNRFQLSKVYESVVKDFLKNSALNGPEHTSRDGQYDEELLEHAEIVTDIDDSEICPDAEKDEDGAADLSDVTQ